MGWSTSGPIALLLIIGLMAGGVGVFRWDRERRTARILYDVDSPELVERLAMANAVGQWLGHCASLWHVYYSAPTTDWKHNAGAGTLIRRTPTRSALGTLPKFELNIETWCVPVGPQQLLFLPDRPTSLGSTSTKRRRTRSSPSRSRATMLVSSTYLTAARGPLGSCAGGRLRKGRLALPRSHLPRSRPRGRRPPRTSEAPAPALPPPASQPSALRRAPAPGDSGHASGPRRPRRDGVGRSRGKGSRWRSPFPASYPASRPIPSLSVISRLGGLIEAGGFSHRAARRPSIFTAPPRRGSSTTYRTVPLRPRDCEAGARRAPARAGRQGRARGSCGAEHRGGTPHSPPSQDTSC